MKTLSLVLILVVSSGALAGDSFGDRVKRAKLVEASADGRAYQQLMWEEVGEHTATVMQQCFPKGTKADTASFVLVANVLPSHALAGVEVQPETRMSRCFADAFSRASFPQPPPSFSEDGIPIVIEIRITP